MKRMLICLMVLCAITSVAQPYVPSEENLRSRAEFRQLGLGVFIHWGIYSLFGRGEWTMSVDSLDRHEYAKAAGAFYPASFDADEWVEHFAASGAKYICFTARHHDGFSMWATRQSSYNIVESSPFHRDILRELADACQRHGMRLHLYYSLVDWGRDDYPLGESATGCGKQPGQGDYLHYLAFMKAQVTELLTEYGPIGGIWLDGDWDHAHDSVPFDWQLRELYDLVHTLQPGCLVANNHHQAIRPGEDIQVFERDVPGENEGGYSEGQEVSQGVPLETCQTMNWTWGYNVRDTGYKSVEQILQLKARANSLGANLLINIGPRPDGRLPEQAIERLHQMGK